MEDTYKLDKVCIFCGCVCGDRYKLEDPETFEPILENGEFQYLCCECAG